MGGTLRFERNAAIEKRDQARTALTKREQAREERQGQRIANYALRMANKGYLDCAIPAKQFRLQPWSGLWFETDFSEGAYAVASSIAADAGLKLDHRRADVIHKDPINEYEYLIELSVLESAEADQSENFAQRVLHRVGDLVN
jgi:hypothetical protein